MDPRFASSHGCSPMHLHSIYRSLTEYALHLWPFTLVRTDLLYFSLIRAKTLAGHTYPIANGLTITGR